MNYCFHFIFFAISIIVTETNCIEIEVNCWVSVASFFVELRRKLTTVRPFRSMINSHKFTRIFFFLNLIYYSNKLPLRFWTLFDMMNQEDYPDYFFQKMVEYQQFVHSSTMSLSWNKLMDIQQSFKGNANIMQFVLKCWIWICKYMYTFDQIYRRFIEFSLPLVSLNFFFALTRFDVLVFPFNVN